jgi:hypothetical protein
MSHGSSLAWLCALQPARAGRGWGREHLAMITPDFPSWMFGHTIAISIWTHITASNTSHQGSVPCALVDNVFVYTTALSCEPGGMIVQIGHMRSWSGYATYRKHHPDAPDPLEDIKPKLATALGCKSDTDPVTMRYPLFAILAKHPRVP